MTEEYFDDIDDLIKKANTNQEVSVSDTPQQQQQQQQQKEEDDNAYYRDQIITRENERYTPTPVQKNTASGNGNGNGVDNGNGKKNTMTNKHNTTRIIIAFQKKQSMVK